MNEILNLSIRNWLILISAVLVMTGMFYSVFRVKNYIIRSIILFLIIGFCYYVFRIFPNIKIVGLVLFIIPLSFGGLIFLFGYEKPPNPIFDIAIRTDKGTKYVRNFLRGISIFGSAGSGKTISLIFPILKHFSEQNFAGIIYDFKDGELTELAIPLFKEKLKIIAIHNASISARVNPISPKLINDENDINEIVAVLMDNLINNGAGKGDDFFKDSGSSLLSAVILKFWLDHPSFCTLPHVISFILAVDFSVQEQNFNQSLGEQAINQFAKLKAFLTDNDRVAIQGSAFILGLASERQTASVLSTLANALRKISSPKTFWVLSGNEIDFDINSDENRSVISVLNEPKNSKFLSPINASIIHSISKQMMVRNRHPSFLVLDEAPTIKLLNMAQIPATMRSFQVGVIYCAQDIVQGIVQYGRDGFKEILANLSTQFFGKSNDPDTSKFYESYFELVKEKTKSISEKGDFLSGGRTITTGEKEVSKYRASRFQNLKVGEFAMLSDGKNQIYHIQAEQITSEKILEKKEISNSMLNSNFTKIINEVKLLID